MLCSVVGLAVHVLKLRSCVSQESCASSPTHPGFLAGAVPVAVNPRIRRGGALVHLTSGLLTSTRSTVG